MRNAKPELCSESYVAGQINYYLGFMQVISLSRKKRAIQTPITIPKPDQYVWERFNMVLKEKEIQSNDGQIEIDPYESYLFRFQMITITYPHIH